MSLQGKDGERNYGEKKWINKDHEIRGSKGYLKKNK